MPALRTPGTWTREQAIAASKKGRSARLASLAARRLKRQRLEKLSLEPVSLLPSLLREQIAGASLHLEKAQREGKAKQVKEWAVVVRQLVELERYIENPSRKSSSSNGQGSTPAAAATPKLAARPQQNSGSAPDSSVYYPTSQAKLDPDPLEHAPLD